MSGPRDDDTYDLSSDPPPPIPARPPRPQTTRLAQQAAMYPKPAFTGRNAPPAPPPAPGAGRRAGLIAGAIVAGVVGVIVATVVGARLARDKNVPAPLQVDRAAFPERPAMRRVSRGVRFCEVNLRGKGPGQAMKVWVYLPDGEHAPASVPCVFVAPAGSTLVTGMDLGDGDRPEHLPYVKAGFAVVSYELDGALPDRARNSDGQIAAAVKKFIKAEAGLANAKTAVEFALAKVPEVDPKRLYCAGHSSAATLALQLAATEPRMKGCVAYAPCTNIGAKHGAQLLRNVERFVPGAKDFMKQYSPLNMPPKCPVFLFHALDDSVVDAEESRLYASQHGGRVQLVTVPEGDHHEAMMLEGMPRGVEWLQKQAGVRTPAKKRRKTPAAPTGEQPAEVAEPAAESPERSEQTEPTDPAEQAPDPSPDPDAGAETPADPQP